MSLPPNFGRAVDLSSLGKPAPQPSGPVPGKAVTAENLTTEFLELSSTKPVIVLVWSPRSPESITTLQSLAELQTEDAGAWELGQINADTDPEVAQAIQTKSVPYAVAFIGGQMVPLFEQPYPREQIRLVITKVLELAAQQGIGDAPVEKIEPEEEEALTALESGDYEAARDAYKKLLSRKPADSFAKLGLAQTELLIRTKGLDASVVKEKAASAPEDISAQLQCADVEVMSTDVETAFNRLLELVKRTDGDDKKRVKDHLLSLFALVDPADPRLIAARNALANALF
jgi:putative thioredoxin